MSHVFKFWEHLPRMRQVLSQELCYVGAMFVGIVISTFEVVDWPSGHPVVLTLQVLLQPLQRVLGIFGASTTNLFAIETQRYVADRIHKTNLAMGVWFGFLR